MGAFFALLGILGVLVLWKVPQWQVARVEDLDSEKRFDKRNEARKTLATILGGVAFLVGGYFTWQNLKVQQASLKESHDNAEKNLRTAQDALRASESASAANVGIAQKSLEQSKLSSEASLRNAQESLRASEAAAAESLALTRQGQFAERFVKAVEQLGALDANGKPKLEIRLGGIYALEAIANESKDLHWPIMEVLCAYIRKNAPAKFDPRGGVPRSVESEEAKSESNSSGSPRAPIDIQALLTVIGRRSLRYEQPEQKLDLFLVDLARTDLSKGHFEKAILGGSNFSGARLEGTHLSEAILVDANFRNADFESADLTGANLAFATLKSSNMKDTVLVRAIIAEADLSSAWNLTQEQVNSARGDGITKLPTPLCVPRNWWPVNPHLENLCKSQ